MAAKGQTEASSNLGNTNKIAGEVGERTEEEKGNSTIGDAYVNFKDFQNSINYLEICLKFFRQVGDRAGEGLPTVILATPITVLKISREP